MAQGLEGLRVVELGGWVSAPTAGKLLGDLGATVVKVEPPQGDPARRRGPFPSHEPDPEASGMFLALNVNKRSVVLDIVSPAGRQALDELATQADILLHNFAPAEMARQDITFERFAALNPRLVMLSITPFGLTGPYRDYAAVDLTLFHASGLSWVFADPVDVAGQPPVKFFGHQADVQAGIYGAVAALGAHYGAQATGRGEHIDLSTHSVNAAFHGPNFVEFTYAGRIINRYKPRLFAPAQYYPCRDGYLFIVCPEEDQWERLVDMMGNPDWARDPRFADGWHRGANLEALNANIEAWTRTWRAEDLYHACQSRHVCATMLYRPAQLFDQPHLQARGFVKQQVHPVVGTIPMPGAPFKLKRDWWAIRRPAPLLGEATAELSWLFGEARPAAAASARNGNGSDPVRPLAGVRVLDLTWYWAGPHCTQQLAHLGAEVIKIESPLRPDFTRRFAIYPQGMEGGLNRGGFFNEYGQGKQSVQIDIRHPEGLALIKRLAAQCDVAASNFSTGVMDRFGLGAEDLLRINPEMVVMTVSGFGQTGPLKDYIAYGPTVIPLSGLIAEPRGEEPPQYAATGYGDPNAGIFAAYGILASLVARQRHGGGQTLDVTLWESMINNGFEGWINAALGHQPYPYMGNRDPVFAPHNCFRCRGQDAWLAIAVTDDAQWAGLCRVMGREDLIDEPRYATGAARKVNERALEELISAWSVHRERWEATALLQAHGVPSFPVIDTAELAENPHLHARGFFSRIPHPEVGVRTHTGIPWRLTRGQNGVRSRAPLMGEHTDEVLRRLLRLDDAELAGLRERHVIW